MAGGRASPGGWLPAALAMHRAFHAQQQPARVRETLGLGLGLRALPGMVGLRRRM